MNSDSKIFVAGHKGMVGSAIHRALLKEGYENILTVPSSALDLRNQRAVADFFAKEKPHYVFLAAAKVGGIHANQHYKADFVYDNLMIEANVIHQSYVHKVKKLLFLGSSCIYPKYAQQPLKEESLLTGALEPTNDAYAIAKIAGIKLCQDYRAQYGCNFISAMPTNMYGPNDNYDLAHSHVLPALIRKFLVAKKDHAPFVEVWGTGKPRREFLHVDDMAEASVFLMKHYDKSGIINVGTGEDLSIKDLANKIKKVVRFDGDIRWDANKPDGTPRKLMDVSCIHQLGWKHSIALDQGLQMIYQEMKDCF